MELSEYQRRAQKFAVYPQIGYGYVYPAIGLAGEAGEVFEHIKKACRDDGGNITLDRRFKIEKEIGDVLWYIAALATELGLDLGEVARVNLAKLDDRQKRGVLGGSGDDR